MVEHHLSAQEVMSLGDGGFEAVGLDDDPIGEESSAGAAGDSQLGGVGPVFGDDGADPIYDDPENPTECGYFSKPL